MRLVRPFAAAVALAAVAACAPTAPPPGGLGPQASGPRQCFYASTVSGFRESGTGQVNFMVGGGDVYQLELAEACGGLAEAEKVLLDSRAAGSSVCAGLDADLIVPVAAGAPRRCVGRGLRRLGEAEVAALPAAERP